MASAGAPAEVSYGGQAVIEGVMIRSPRYVSVACRHPNPDGSHGSDTPIDVWTEPVRSLFARFPVCRRIPLLRGMLALFEMLALGLRSLERSANIQTAFLQLLGVLSVDPGPGAESSPAEKGALHGPVMWGTIAVSFALGIGLFVLLPNYLADVVGRWIGASEHGVVLNLIEGLIRMVFFVAYVGLIGLMKDIRRVFQYHGAEHKVVNGYEAGRDLTVEAVLDQSVIHPRCGTNFAFIVIFMSLIVFSCLPWTASVWPRFGMRLLLLPVVAGISFELIKIVGTHRDVAWLQKLIWPGLALQRLTTREPAPDMLEVALASFRAVRLAEETGEVTCAVVGVAAHE